MTKYTTNYALPYPELLDKVAVVADVKNLATKTAVELGGVEDRAKTHTNTEVAALAEYVPDDAPDDGQYAKVTLDEAGRLAMGVRTDGTVYIPRLSRAPQRKIVIVSGQSNSMWRFDTEGPELTEPDRRVKWWNRISETFIDVSPAVTPSIASAFARKYVEENPSVELLIVPVTVGSTGFRTSSINPPPEGYLYSSGGTWDRTLTADPNNLALRLFDSLGKALEATGGAEVVAMLWSQGENDRTRMDTATYGAAFDDFIGEIRSMTAADMPVILGSFTPEEIANPQFEGTQGILRALEESQSRLYNTAYVWGPRNHLEYQEQIHWSPEGNRVRGEDMATYGLRRARLNVAGTEPQSPPRIWATPADGGSLVEWEYPPTRATSFIFETSQDGQTWTTDTLDGPLVRSHTVPGGVRVRVSTVNETGTSHPTMPIVATGDMGTGRRDVSALLTDTDAGALFVQRVNDAVYVTIDGVSPAVAGTVVFATLPAGFRPGSSIRDTVPSELSGTTQSRSIAFSSTGSIVVYGASVEDDYRTHISYITPEPWPATIPGTAA